MSVKINVSNNIIISEPTQEIKQYCKDNLTLDNPDYFKKEKMGKWTGDTPKQILLYEKWDNDLVVPFGCFKDIWSLHKVKADYSSNFAPIRSVDYDSGINLYDYQEKAVQAVLNAKNGVLVSCCGSGKSEMGLEIIARVGGRALWLTHTADLLNQSLNRAKNVLDCDGSCYGTITAGKVHIGSHITFATVQTMCKLNLAEYKNAWDIIIVDEAQHCCGSPTRVTQFYKVLSLLSARYKIGLTATPKRADGLEKSMFALLGGIIHKVDRSAVAEKTCRVVVKTVETGYQPNMDNVLGGDGTIDYMALIDDLINNEDRFKKVLETIEQLDGSAIILANRVAYLQRLNECYSGRSVCLSGAGYTKKAKAERKAALDKLRCGDIDVVFSTYALASEGLDCPTLKYVVLATPEKNPTLIEQSVGRVMRKAPNKKYGIAIDFVDDFPMYKNWSKKRDGYYKKIDANILT